MSGDVDRASLGTGETVEVSAVAGWWKRGKSGQHVQATQQCHCAAVQGCCSALRSRWPALVSASEAIEETQIYW